MSSGSISTGRSVCEGVGEAASVWVGSDSGVATGVLVDVGAAEGVGEIIGVWVGVGVGEVVGVLVDVEIAVGVMVGDDDGVAFAMLVGLIVVGGATFGV